MQERQRQEAARTNVQEFAKEQQNCDVKNLWLITSDGQFQRRAIERQIQECLKKQRSQTEERRKRSEVQLYLFVFAFLRSFPQPNIHIQIMCFLQLDATFVLLLCSSLCLDIVSHHTSASCMPLQAACPGAGGRRAAPAGDGGEAQGGDSRTTSMDERASQGTKRKERGRAKANTCRKNRTTLQVNVCKLQNKTVDTCWIKTM